MKKDKQKSKKQTPTKNGESDQAPSANYWQHTAGQKGGKQGRPGKFDSQPHSVGKKFWRQ